MASSGAVKEECFRPLQFSVKIDPDFRAADPSASGAPVVEISSSSGSSGGDGGDSRGDISNREGGIMSPSAAKRALPDDRNAGSAGPSAKRPRMENVPNVQSNQAHGWKAPDAGLPSDFLKSLPEVHPRSFSPRPTKAAPPAAPRLTSQNITTKPFRQFWKAGDYETEKTGHKSTAGGMDHIRVHPKFLHSNATSHKWALGAIAELLDNALDEAVNGATFVKVDRIGNPKNGEPMLLIEDDGGGMNPDSMRQCMSLGYSAKSKIANTIGQYGNGFKTSTMRLGADVVVFSRCQGKNGRGPTQSVGILSYTFLRETGQEDIIVPMIDFEIQPFGLRKVIRSNVDGWNRNMESIQRWSPYATEIELMDHFKEMKTQGTKIIIYNLWEDDQGELELEFNADRHDIQLRGVNRDEKHITMADRFPHSRHYLTYQHSLRIYASILYLKLPPGFKMFLRGKEIEHHDLIDDLMFTEVLTYKPVASDVQTDTGQMKAVVTVGFVKDAKEHIDVQGFNVYHKNRLIKPFWRLWNSAASRGRGIIGVLEANFVEPAHDKQGFERTIVLARLEARLVEMQKSYWSKHCHKVGYVNLSLKGKDGKAAESNGPPLALEATPPTLAAPLSMMPLHQTPLSVAPAVRPPNLVASSPATFGGGVSGAQNMHVPPALARSQQLQSQVQVVRRANDVNVPLMRQAVPGPSVSAGILPHRQNVLTGNHTVLSNLSMMENAHTQEKALGHLHNANRSPLPRPPLGIRPISHQPEAVNPHNARRSPLPGPPLGMVSSPQRPGFIAQAVPLSSAQANGISAAQLTTQPGSNPNVGVQSSPHYSTTTVGQTRVLPLVPGDEGFRQVMARTGPNLAQNLPVRSTMLAGDVTAKYAGHCGETFRSVTGMGGQDLVPNSLGHSANLVKETGEQSTSPVGDLLRPAAGISTSLGSSAVVQGFAVSPSSQGMNAHPPDKGVVSANPSVQDATVSGALLIVEGNSTHTNDVSVKGKENEVTQNNQIGQSFANPTGCIKPKAHGTVQKNDEVHILVESSASPSTLADLSGTAHTSPRSETNVLQVPCLPSEQSPTHKPLGLEGSSLHAPQIPAEQCLSKVSRISAKETALGRKSLENLGRMFAKKAASITMNPGDQTKDPTAPVEELTESGANIRSIVQSGSNLELDTPTVANQELEVCMVANKEVETRLVVLEVEVTALQQKLNSLKMERDSLRHQLLEERLKGRLSKQELQLKVEQTWSKVRELEAKNGRLHLLQARSTD